MNHLWAILGLGVACGLWGLLQIWIRKVDEEVGSDPHCACHSKDLHELENRRR